MGVTASRDGCGCAQPDEVPIKDGDEEDFSEGLVEFAGLWPSSCATVMLMPLKIVIAESRKPIHSLSERGTKVTR